MQKARLWRRVVCLPRARSLTDAMSLAAQTFRRGDTLSRNFWITR